MIAVAGKVQINGHSSRHFPKIPSAAVVIRNSSSSLQNTSNFSRKLWSLPRSITCGFATS